MIYFEQGREPNLWLWMLRKSDVSMGMPQEDLATGGWDPASSPSKGNKDRNPAAHNLPGK